MEIYVYIKMVLANTHFFSYSNQTFFHIKKTNENSITINLLYLLWSHILMVENSAVNRKTRIRFPVRPI